MSELGDGSVESLNIGRDEEVPTTGDSNVTTRAQRAEQEDMRHEDLEDDCRWGRCRQGVDNDFFCSPYAKSGICSSRLLHLFRQHLLHYSKK